MDNEKELVRNLFNDGINHMSFSRENFCEEALKEHRYLQNEFTLLCIEWLKTCARDDYRYDERNEYSHRVAVEATDCLREKHLI